MEDKGTIFKPGRLVNAATLGKSKLSDDERRAVNNAKPIRNKYMEAASKTQGCIIIHDPTFMLWVMRFMLDTNIFIYYVTDNGLLSEDVYDAISEPNADLCISTEKDGHKDPSDNVIISHAITNRMILVSSDTNFPYYVDYGLDLLYNEK